MKKELIKALEDDGYDILKENAHYHLYDKTKDGKYSKYPYVATIEISTNQYLFNEISYKDVETLRCAIDTYITTLPYPYENYDPTWWDQCFVKYGLQDYLEGLGFEAGTDENVWVKKDMYRRSIIDLYIIFNKDCSKTDGEVILCPNKSSSSLRCKFTGLESGFAAVNSIISPYILSLLSSLLITKEAMNGHINNDGVEEICHTSIFDQTVTPFKEITIQMLEKALTELKK